ncbi:hypothetical protein [Fluviispira multicolorata]|uniref:Uncharacterized protein n=1 Tax=Fluviispira multicolorata TaxID=2654512 RepID=A0A833JEH0_9BACT|nr:hypothetical protein [Fluviispira multicolorata]KAB8029874.1 hypothetical protein GCL57_10070 [Fluviispira multicolorata]
MKIRVYDNSLYSFFESIKDLIIPNIPGGQAITSTLRFIDLLSSIKLNSFLKNFDENDNKNLAKLIDLKDESLFEIFNMFDKSMKCESLWVIRCLATITKKLINKEKLNDNEHFFCDTLPNMNDNDLEFFCNLRELWKIRESKIINKIMELQHTNLELEARKYEIKTLEAELNKKWITPHLEEIFLLKISSLEHAFAKINRLVKFGALHGDRGGVGGLGQAHGFAVWGNLSENLYNFIINYK